jgi:hypothetical protein
MLHVSSTVARSAAGSRDSNVRSASPADPSSLSSPLDQGASSPSPSSIMSRKVSKNPRDGVHDTTERASVSARKNEEASSGKKALRESHKRSAKRRRRSES